MSSTSLETEDSSSAIWLYKQVRYTVF